LSAGPHSLGHAYGGRISRGVATRTDTPFHINGLTETLTASLVLRCVEERRLSLVHPAVEPVLRQRDRQVLTHVALLTVSSPIVRGG
jgi:hypothetical protein